MKLKNSSGIPDEQIREIINFVKPQGVTKFDIEIKKSRFTFSGLACPLQNRVLVKINKNLRFPYIKYPYKAYLGFKAFALQECLVYVIGHELRHVWQGKHRKGWRVWGAKGRYSERDACAYGIHMMREWRRK